LRQQFGPVSVPDDFQREWQYIPHIYASPFYCYAYSFGMLLSLALYGMYREEGAPFVAKYEKLLAGGGSAAPQDLLKPHAAVAAKGPGETISSHLLGLEGVCDVEDEEAALRVHLAAVDGREEEPALGVERVRARAVRGGPCERVVERLVELVGLRVERGVRVVVLLAHGVGEGKGRGGRRVDVGAGGREATRRKKGDREHERALHGGRREGGAKSVVAPA